MSEAVDTHAEFVAGLRELADFYESRPDMPLPYTGTTAPLNIWTFGNLGGDERDPKAALGQIARFMGRAEKVTDDRFFFVSRSFGPIRLEAGAYREEVCERVVVGTETDEIEDYDPDALALVPKVTKRIEREVVEWKCPESILRVVKR